MEQISINNREELTDWVKNSVRLISDKTSLSRCDIKEDKKDKKQLRIDLAFYNVGGMKSIKFNFSVPSHFEEYPINFFLMDGENNKKEIRNIKTNSGHWILHKIINALNNDISKKC